MAKDTISPLSKYTDSIPVDVYILAKAGLSDERVSEGLGINRLTFTKWKKKYTAIQHALTRARTDDSIANSTITFRDYVYKRLDPHLRALWDKIELWSDHDNGMERVEALLNRETVRIRQSIWMHAMVQSNFNASEACRKTCISHKTICNWKDNDPEFPKLIDEIAWHRNNLFEGTLIKLVKSGNVLATLFANRTQNRDRGYSDKVTVEHTGNIQHNHAHVISIDRLKLPLTDRRALLDRVREIQEEDRRALDNNSEPEATEVETLAAR